MINTLKRLIGSAPSQLPRNRDLGKMAFMDSPASIGPLGYTKGAGSTVTQATSRTTGVTINALTGQITLFFAAGSTTYATFTVTNSQVAATDVISISQVSGSNLYITLVTAVAAGSFNVSVATTGGTTSEAPVFNFIVIKGAAN